MIAKISLISTTMALRFYAVVLYMVLGTSRYVTFSVVASFSITVVVKKVA